MYIHTHTHTYIQVSTKSVKLDNGEMAVTRVKKVNILESDIV